MVSFLVHNRNEDRSTDNRYAGLILAASVDDEQVCILWGKHAVTTDLIISETTDALSEPKSQMKMILRRLNNNSEPQMSIESGQYTIQCVQNPHHLSHPHQTTSLSSLAANSPSPPFQLPPPILSHLPHNLRSLLPTQTRLHLPLRPRRRIHNRIPLHTIPLPHLPSLFFPRIRHFYPTNQENIPRFPRHTESR